MEKGIDSYLKEQFEIPDVDIRTYSPLTLAYIGDGIYDLVIRSLVVAKGKKMIGWDEIVDAHQPDCKGTHTGGDDGGAAFDSDRGGGSRV